MGKRWRQDRLDHVQEVIKDDIAKGLYYGVSLKVARAGEVEETVTGATDTNPECTTDGITTVVGVGVGVATIGFVHGFLSIAGNVCVQDVVLPDRIGWSTTSKAVAVTTAVPPGVTAPVTV